MGERIPVIELYVDRALRWRWRLKAGNGEIVAVGQSHKRRSDCLRAIDTFQTLAHIAKLRCVDGCEDLPDELGGGER